MIEDSALLKTRMHMPSELSGLIIILNTLSAQCGQVKIGRRFYFIICFGSDPNARCGRFVQNAFILQIERGHRYPTDIKYP